jgi:hypothetical protein
MFHGIPLDGGVVLDGARIELTNRDKTKQYATLIRVPGLGYRGLGYFAMAPPNINPLFTIRSGLNDPEGIFLVVTDESMGGKPRHRVSNEIVESMNDFITHKFKHKKMQCLEQIHVHNQFLFGDVKVGVSSSKSPPHIFCYKCKVMNKYICFINRKEDLLCCQSCYDEMSYDMNKSKFVNIKDIDVEKRATSYSGDKHYRAFVKKFPEIVSSALKKHLPYDIVAFGIHTDLEPSRIDLHVLYVMPNHLGCGAATQILDLFRRYGVYHEKQIYVTMSQCEDTIQSQLYVKSFRILWGEFVGFYDENSLALKFAPNAQNWNELSKNAGCRLIILLQRYRLYCRFQDLNGLSELDSFITIKMQMTRRLTLLKLCLDVLNEDIEREDINSYLDFLMHDDFKQTEEYQGIIYNAYCYID